MTCKRCINSSGVDFLNSKHFMTSFEALMLHKLGEL